jgi:hypothetical protein
LERGLGGTLALIYWGVVAAMLVVFAVLIGLMFGPAIWLLWGVLCGAAYGLGLVLCGVAGVLTIAEGPRKGAIAFLVTSAVANAGLLVLAVILGALVWVLG